MTQFRNELIDAKNNSKIESETPANEGTINRFIVETYWEAIRTVELDVLLKSGKQTKIRSSLSFWQEEEGSEPYYCVSFWEIPQDSYTVLLIKSTSKTQKIRQPDADSLIYIEMQFMTILKTQSF